MLLNPVDGVTIHPQRRTTDFGETNWTDLDPIELAIPQLDEARPNTNGEGYTQSGTLFVPRGSDLQDGDRFRFQKKTFGVIGDAMWDMNHPLTGDDFGYVYYAIQLGG
uniref:Head-to-tail stopper n=1 Tax=Mycobacterium phage Farewell TaxID=3158893 RepID=A0AAU8GPZ8_9CAUD